jgi:hypothetical protein
MNRSVRYVMFAVAGLLVAPAARSVEIGWWTIDGGGGRSTGGDLVVRGTVAQLDAGSLVGGDITLEGGFWIPPAASVVAVADEGAPSDPRVAFLRGGAPNPFVGRTDIHFALPRHEQTTIAVYDLAGRLVARLVDGVLPPGRHQVTWTGRDASGRPVASGIYFVRMQAGDFGAVRKLLRMD